ncbi:hypothetical protein [Amycolatopsis minnesotensis]|uniref:Uncharacterized protein n=1 Tax=Amycolatopsis minnesotensis TaxID=337894 RepID=A0ABP5DQL4_9PSEU
MSLVVDRMRERAPQAGPDRWQAAWTRTIELYAPIWRTRGWPSDVEFQVDAATAVALGMYLIAEERDIPVAEVHTADLRTLLLTGPGHAEVALWDRKLRELSHDPDDEADPVSAHWRILRQDQAGSDPAEFHLIPDSIWFDPTTRVGPLIGDALHHALAPIWNVEF